MTAVQLSPRTRLVAQPPYRELSDGEVLRPADRHKWKLPAPSFEFLDALDRTIRHS